MSLKWVRGVLIRVKPGNGELAQLVRIQIIVKGDKRYLRNLMMIFILIQHSLTFGCSLTIDHFA